MDKWYVLTTPLSSEKLKPLRVGDRVLLSGTVYTARDAAHKRLAEAIARGLLLPMDLDGQVLYYAGPAPAAPGEIIGPIGPTTSGRMDRYTPLLLELGLKAMIGKGRRSKEVIDAIVKNGAIYLGATGGAAVLLASHVERVQTLAYEDLGPEAILKLEVREMPLVVLVDPLGNDLYDVGPEEARRLLAQSSSQPSDIE